MTLTLLKNCAVWGLAVCAMLLISPAIVIYAVPFAIGIASDIAQLDCGLIALSQLQSSFSSALWDYYRHIGTRRAKRG